MHLHALSVRSWLAASPPLRFYLSEFDAPAVPNPPFTDSVQHPQTRHFFETSIFSLIYDRVRTGRTPARVQVQSCSMLHLSPALRLRARVSFSFFRAIVPREG